MQIDLTALQILDWYPESARIEGSDMFYWLIFRGLICSTQLATLIDGCSPRSQVELSHLRSLIREARENFRLFKCKTCDWSTKVHGCHEPCFFLSNSSPPTRGKGRSLDKCEGRERFPFSGGEEWPALAMTCELLVRQQRTLEALFQSAGEESGCHCPPAACTWGNPATHGRLLWKREKSRKRAFSSTRVWRIESFLLSLASGLGIFLTC